MQNAHLHAIDYMDAVPDYILRLEIQFLNFANSTRKACSVQTAVCTLQAFLNIYVPSRLGGQ